MTAPDDKDDGPLDPFGGLSDEEEWGAAIEEWDRSLELPESTGEAESAQPGEQPAVADKSASPSEQSAQPATGDREPPRSARAPSSAGGEPQDAIDPLMAFVAGGEIEIDEEAGSALGTLLGGGGAESEAAAESRGAPVPAQSDEDDVGEYDEVDTASRLLEPPPMPDEDDEAELQMISPEEVAAGDAVIEISRVDKLPAPADEPSLETLPSQQPPSEQGPVGAGRPAEDEDEVGSALRDAASDIDELFDQLIGDPTEAVPPRDPVPAASGAAGADRVVLPGGPGDLPDVSPLDSGSEVLPQPPAAETEPDLVQLADHGEPEVAPPAISAAWTAVEDAMWEQLVGGDLGGAGAADPRDADDALWWEKLQHVGGASASADDSAVAGDLQLLAGIAAERCGARSSALAAYEQVLAGRPDDVGALIATWRLHQQAGDAQAAVSTLEGLAPALSDSAVAPAARALLAEQRGMAVVGSGGEAAAQHEPQLAEALAQLRLGCQLGDPIEQGRALDRLASQSSPGATRAALLVEAGRLFEADGEAADALGRYRDASSEDPANASAAIGMLRIAELLGDHQAMGDALLQCARRLRPWEPALVRRRASLAEYRGLPDVDTLAIRRQAHELDDRDVLALEQLVAALRESGRLEEAFQLQQRLVARCTEADERAQAVLLAGDLAERIGSRDEALALYGEAASGERPLPRAAAGVARLGREDPSPHERLEAERAAAAGALGGAGAVHHLAAARILAEELDDDRGAREELVAALRADGACGCALDRLAVLAGGDRSPEIVDLLADLGREAADPQRGGELLRRAAAALEGSDGPSERTSELFAAAVERDPDNLEALRGLRRSAVRSDRPEQAARALDELAQRTEQGARVAVLWTARGYEQLAAGELEAASASFDAAAVAAPDPIGPSWGKVLGAAADQRWAEVCDLLDAMAEGAASARQKAALRFRAADVREHELGDHAAALVGYRLAVQDAAQRTDYADALLGCGRRVGELDQLAPELQRRAARASGAEQLICALELAEALDQGGQDLDAVEASYRIALDADSAHPAATRGFERVLSERGDWQELSALLVDQLEQADEERIRGLVRERLALRELERGEPQVAAEALAAATQQQGEAFAPRMLRQLALRAQRHEEAARWLEHEAESADGDDARVLWTELGRSLLRAGSPATEDEALRAAHRAFCRAHEAGGGGGHRLAWRWMLATLAIDSDPKDAGAQLARYAGQLDDAREGALLFSRAAALRGDDLALYRTALQRAPEHLVAAIALCEAGLRAGDREAAAEGAEAEAAASREPEHRLAASVLAGELALERGDEQRASEYFRAALSAQPLLGRPLQRLRELLAAGGRHAELVELLELRLAAEQRPTARAALHRDLAGLYLSELDDSERAREQLEPLLELVPDDRAALDQLADLCERAERWSDAANALIRRARLERDRAALRAYLLRLGRIYHEHEPDARRAIASLRKALSLDGNDLEALGRLSSIYIQQLDFEPALQLSERLYEVDPDPQRRVDHLLQIATIYEDGLRDAHRAGQALRRAMELAPADLKAIGATCGFYARQGDQRSVMIHLDRAVATMRSRLAEDPFEEFAYRALFQIFGWRKSPDGCLCAAQVLDALGYAGSEQQAFIDGHGSGVGAAGAELGASEHDERLFHADVPGGFRQIFKLLREVFDKVRPGDLRGVGVARGDRVSNPEHPLRLILDPLAGDFGVAGYDLYISERQAEALIVENTAKPSIVLGKAMVGDASEDEIRFIGGRSFWLISRAMILPSRLPPEDLEILVAAVVRHYVPEFEPPDVNLQLLRKVSRQVSIPRRLRQELMPFALECSGHRIDLRSLHAAVIHSANRAGLLACRSVLAACSVLRREAGRLDPARDAAELRALLQDNPQVEQLLRFSVSDEHLRLRRDMNMAIR